MKKEQARQELKREQDAMKKALFELQSFTEQHLGAIEKASSYDVDEIRSLHSEKIPFVLGGPFGWIHKTKGE